MKRQWIASWDHSGVAGLVAFRDRMRQYAKVELAKKAEQDKLAAMKSRPKRTRKKSNVVPITLGVGVK